MRDAFQDCVQYAQRCRVLLSLLQRFHTDIYRYESLSHVNRT